MAKSKATSGSLDPEELSRQFDDAIDQVEAALRACPSHHWEASMWHVPRTDPWVWPRPGVPPVPERTDEAIQQFSAFWFVAYHCLWFLDFYATADPKSFQSPDYVRGGAEEMAWPEDGAAPLPDCVLTRDDLLAYAAHGRRRVRELIQNTSAAEFKKRVGPQHPHAGKTLYQLLGVNLAHVREHGGQMADFVATATDG